MAQPSDGLKNFLYVIQGDHPESSREENHIKKAYVLGANPFLVKTGQTKQFNEYGQKETTLCRRVSALREVYPHGIARVRG
jgi:hypothetical protein